MIATKKNIIKLLLVITILTPFFNLSLGIYFGVLTNVLINVFWKSNIDTKINNKKDVPPFR